MTRLLAVVVLVACSGSPGPRSTGTTQPTGSGAAAGSAVALTETRSDEQCRQLVAHAVQLGSAERPAEQRPSEAERTAIETRLRERSAAGCKQMSSTAYACAMAARTLAALEACGE